MAGQPATSPVPAPASVVGNAFVNQYYEILHQSPQNVHCFYRDGSHLSRAESGLNAALESVSTQAEIHEKIMAWDYGDVRAEIKSIDSQDSLSGSVLVMVTGSFSTQGIARRNFAQTFFLAPQEKGFFVLNDIFRYLDGDVQSFRPASQSPPPVLTTPGLANGLTEMADEPVQAFDSQEENVESSILLEQDVMDYHNVCEYPPPVEAVESVAEADEELHITERSFKEVIAHRQSAAVEHFQSFSREGSDELPKKSYASILRAQKDDARAQAPSLQPVLNKAVSTQSDQAMASSQSSPLSVDVGDEGAFVNREGDAHSIYVKNLPLTITEAELEHEFGKFGSLKPGGVNLRNQKMNVCFAFIDFEEASSCQRAIEASPISIKGRPVYVEEKKPMLSRVGTVGRGGRFSQGRGYQNQGTGGRSGRGYGRGVAQDSDRGRGSGTGWKWSPRT